MVVSQVLNWPNAENEAKELARKVLVDGVPATRVGRETAPGDDFEPPCIRIERTGGQINRDRTQDAPLIEFACFGRTYDEAQAMSMMIDQILADHIGERVLDATLGSAVMENGPIRPAWGRNAQRDITTWRLTWRPIVVS